MGLDMYLYRKDVDQVAYWRKDNAIHGWFIKNYADGVDDCKPIEVDRIGLITLRDICLRVAQANNTELAMELLPPVSGFFFGSTTYDEYYYGDLNDTIEIINRCLESKFDYFEYQASW